MVVLNPIALDVPEEIFRATHHPSLVHKAGAVHGSVVRADERELLDEFLSSTQSHVFTAAIGDTGTGKSHFIRWLYLQVTGRILAKEGTDHVVMIPRSAANLADVVRLILQGFSGEATERLRREVEKHRGLSEAEARTRVLDELAIAIENTSIAGGDEEAEFLQEALPAFVRDHAVRTELQQDGGVVSRLARHVLGNRESAEPETLRWTDDELKLPVAVVARAGADAGEVAAGLLNDDRLRLAAVSLLNSVHGTAIGALLRFRSGDLKRALNEIRAQLARQKRQLILFLEDLSITEGLDGELLEALQVRTLDTGVALCTLRSIVGLTRDDYQRLRDNIRGRLTRTLWFDVSVGDGSAESEANQLARFSARYLNAARLESAELHDWAAMNSDAPAPSACETCTNRVDCHAAFGEVEGNGLYPLTHVALTRLYRQVVPPDGARRLFKPRALLALLRDMLDESARGLARKNFPAKSLIQSFKLGNTTSDLQLALRRELGADGDRVLRAIELYAAQPSFPRPILPGAIASAFDIPLPSWRESSSPAVEEPAVVAPARDSSPPEPPRIPELDEYDRWLRGDTPSDSSVNNWRKAILDGVLATIDWDVERLAHVRSSLRISHLRIDGQRTRTLRPLLEISRTAENVATLRALIEDTSVDGRAEAHLRTARRQLIEWASVVRRGLVESTIPDAPDPVLVGIQLLAIGAIVHGKGARTGKEAALLDACLSKEWSPSRGYGTAWAALANAFEKHAEQVQQIVHHALACTKGGQRGRLLEPARILSVLRDIRRGDLPDFHYPDTEWGVFASVGSLAEKAALHLKQALLDERAHVESWLSAVRTHLADDSPKDVAELLKETLDATSAVGHGSTQLRKAVQGLQGRPLNRVTDDASKVQQTADEMGQLFYLGRLDRPLMDDLLKTLTLAHDTLTQADTDLTQQVRDVPDERAAQALLDDIIEQLRLIAVAYEQLGSE